MSIRQVHIVAPARSADDFDAAAGFCRKLGQWDAERAPAHGVAAADVVAAFHPDLSGGELAAKFAGPDAAMLLARVDGTPAGCLAFEPFGDEASELAKFFVDASFRGRGIGAVLLEAAIAEIGNGRRRTVLVHTAVYMEAALKTYAAFGVAPCPRFRDTPEPVRHADVFLSLSLPSDGRAGASPVAS